jgi:RimJ/RimL family protein N-acetyltransferase
MGGADPQNATLTILKQVVALNYQGEIEVVVGSSYLHLNSLQGLLKNSPAIKVWQDLTAEGMYEIMLACPIAILTPSTVALEFLSTGGLLFLHQTVENQSCIKKYLLRENVAFDYTSFSRHAVSNDRESLFNSVTQIQKKLICASSLERVQKLFRIMSNVAKLDFRQATMEDIDQCFEWANDPEVRKYSYSGDPILWETHVEWFSRKLSDPNGCYFLVEIEGQRAGQVRFDNSEQPGNFLISYSLDKAWRGKRLGNYVISKSIQELAKHHSVQKITGYVQNFNIASIKSFEKAGFEKLPSLKYPDSCKFEFTF